MVGAPGFEPEPGTLKGCCANRYAILPQWMRRENFLKRIFIYKYRVGHETAISTYSRHSTIFKENIMSSSNIYSSPLCSCVICRQELTIKGIASHYVRKHTNLSVRDPAKGSQKFQLRCSCTVCRQEVTAQNIEKHFKKHFNKQPKTCSRCGRHHIKPGVYCSRSCANTRAKTSETKALLSAKLKAMYQSGELLPQNYASVAYTKVAQCVVCLKWFPGRNRACSAACRQQLFSAAGKNSAANRVKRSKKEIELYEYCANHFSKVTHNEAKFQGWDADILIHDLKLAVLWNGAWHYKEMGIKGHSLKQVQTRDAIKLNAIAATGWQAIVFEDRYYTPKEAFECIVLRALDSN